MKELKKKKKITFKKVIKKLAGKSVINHWNSNELITSGTSDAVW